MVELNNQSNKSNESAMDRNPELVDIIGMSELKQLLSDFENRVLQYPSIIEKRDKLEISQLQSKIAELKEAISFKENSSKANSPAMSCDDLKNKLEQLPEESEIRKIILQKYPLNILPLSFFDCDGIGYHYGMVYDCVTFGSYWKSDDKKAPLYWRILRRQGNKVCLLSDQVIDGRPYNDEGDSVTWENCSIRKWLNSTFLNTAFSDEEQTLISDTSVSADKNPKFNTDPGNATTDKIFLLSIDEVNNELPICEDAYEPNELRMCAPTSYALAHGIGNSDMFFAVVANCDVQQPTTTWILRTPGSKSDYCAFVDCRGDIDYEGIKVDETDGIRPAMWVDLDKLKIETVD